MKKFYWPHIVVYRVLFIFPFILPMYLAFMRADVVAQQVVSGWQTRLVTFVKFSWLCSIPRAFANFRGLLIGPVDKKDYLNYQSFQKSGRNPTKKLIITRVSKGNNEKALIRSLTKSKEILDLMKVNYELEVVTDSAQKKKISDVHYYLVPKNYQTSQGAKYKARALQYALEQRHERMGEEIVHSTDDWIFHLDEESVLTPSVVVGIHIFIKSHKSNVIGQGEIHYNSHEYGKYFTIAAVDAMRTGDDLGRFRWQFFDSNKALAGIHGSFLLVPAWLEYSITFDFNAKGCITEDTYFGLLAMQNGVKFDRVDGHIREQSPFSLRDVIKQRRRRYCGIGYLIYDKRMTFSTRGFLIMAWFGRTFSSMAPIATVINFLFTSYFPFYFTFLAATITSVVGQVYLIGVYRNVQYLTIPRWKKLWYMIATYLLLIMQFSPLIEMMGVIYGLIKPVKTFDIVQKN